MEAPRRNWQWDWQVPTACMTFVPTFYSSVLWGLTLFYLPFTCIWTSAVSLPPLYSINGLPSVPTKCQSLTAAQSKVTTSIPETGLDDYQLTQPLLSSRHPRIHRMTALLHVLKCSSPPRNFELSFVSHVSERQ